MKIVLASSSPRRLELLAEAGYDVEVRVPDVDETPREGENPAELVERLAIAKANAVRREASEIVVAADTVVVLGSEILGKPRDESHAIEMLTALSGCTHEVITAFCVLRDRRSSSHVARTSVTFHPLTPSEIHAYVSSGEPMDKAGAYGIQEQGGKFVQDVSGSHSNVVGLPMEAVKEYLHRAM